MRTPCGRLERLSYERHARDLETCESRGLVFDMDEAARIDGLYRNVLRLGRNEWQGQPFIPAPWQKFINDNIFGWKIKESGLRRFKTAYIEVPRKNGKTEWAAATGVILLGFDGENTPEIYSVATERETAKIVLQSAMNIIQQSPALRSYLQYNKQSIWCSRNGGWFHALSSEARNLQGKNIHGAIVDELHAHHTRHVWDVVATARGARRQPLIPAITTAGVGREGICWEQRNYSEKILDGIFVDDSHFVFIASAEKDMDWRLEETWRIANPNYGVSVKPEYVRDECTKAIQTPGYQNTFRRYNLNQWCEQVTRWLDMDVWRACAGETPDELLAGRVCYLGVDLSRTTDLTALAAIFPPCAKDGKWRVKAWGFIPDDCIEKRGRRDNVPYAAWVRDGHLIATPGKYVDYEFVTGRVMECVARYEVKEICYDPYNATKWITDLTGAGMNNLVEVRQGAKTLSDPSKQLEKLVLSGEIVHDGNPVLNWCASNLCMKVDSNSNITPDKEKSTERIDLMVAILTGLARATTWDWKAGSGGVCFL